MSKEEKELLLRDLCARLPHGVKIHLESLKYGELIGTLDAVYPTEERVIVDELDKAIAPVNVRCGGFKIEENKVKPYLRPMSSLTEDEKEELKKICEEDLSEFAGFITNGHGLSHDGLYMFDKLRQLEFCLSHHLDFRGMIEKGLALQAPEGMYK